MTPERAIHEAETGTLPPVTLLLGEERYLKNQVLTALSRAFAKGAIPGLNEDDFNAAEVDVSRVTAAARTLPMMAKRRWVLVRELDRWEGKSDGETAPTGKSKKHEGALDELAAYSEAPSETTVLVLLATKLDSRRRLVTLAKKKDFLVKCDPIPKKDLPNWVNGAARRRGRTLSPSAAELIAEVAGPELSVIDDLVERLSLFVADGREIEEDHIGELVPVVRPATVWELVDAIGRGHLGQALASLGKVYDPDDRGLRLLSVIAWSTRQLLRFQAARNAGKSPDQAASEAGVPPFRTRHLEAQTRRSAPGQYEAWLGVLAALDLDLKGGSKRPPRAILESALVELCRVRPNPSQPGAHERGRRPTRALDP